MVFLFLLIIPLLVATTAFLAFNKKIVWFEFLIQIAAQIAIAGICCGIMYWSNTSDVEIWNGHVTAKKSEKVHCRHDYCCGYCKSCSRDSKGNESCHEYCCRTCYYHDYDIDWLFWTTDTGERSVSTIDWQGLREPPRWTQVVIGEPTASSHSYTNYIKAAPDSLFRDQGLVEKFKTELPKYPGEVYDYYRIHRIVSVLPSLNNNAEWNQALSDLNSRLNPAKEVNAILVVTSKKPHDYFQALRQHWMGGKKNDVVLVIDINDDLAIDWVDVMAWTDHKEFEVKLRDSIKDLQTLDLHNPKQVMQPFENAISQYYVRKHMKDFKYLKASITPSITQWIVCLIIGFLSSIGISWYMVVNDVDEASLKRYRRYR